MEYAILSVGDLVIMKPKLLIAFPGFLFGSLCVPSRGVEEERVCNLDSSGPEGLSTCLLDIEMDTFGPEEPSCTIMVSIDTTQDGVLNTSLLWCVDTLLQCNKNNHLFGGSQWYARVQHCVPEPTFPVGRCGRFKTTFCRPPKSILPTKKRSQKIAPNKMRR